MVNWNEFGERFHILRRRKKLTLKDIASQAGTSYVTVSLLERGKKPQISLDVVVRLAKVLDVSLDYLGGWKEKESVNG